MTSTKHQKIGADVRRAFQSWMKGEPYAALKKAVGKPMMHMFTQLAGVTTWKQARAKRQAARKARAS
jgi:hypothetical protein